MFLLDVVQEWLANHGTESITGKELSISGITTYQPFDGLQELKTAVAGFMSQAVGRPLFSNPAQVVLTAGATPAIVILVFSLADPGNAFLLPSPYCPELMLMLSHIRSRSERDVEIERRMEEKEKAREEKIN